MYTEIPFARAIGFPILSTLIFLPMALAVLVFMARSKRAASWIATAGAGLVLALAALAFNGFKRGLVDFQLVERVPLGLGVTYHLGVDGISVLFVPLTALLTLLVVLHGREVDQAEPRRYLAVVFAIEAALMGSLVAMDLLLFWLFATIEILPVSLLIRRWGVGSKRRRARDSYVAFSLMSAALLLAGVVLLGLRAAGGPGAGVSFDLLDVGRAPLALRDQTLIFAFLFLGLSIRVPLFPFHGWLPLVLEEGPGVGVSAFIVGIKLGAFGLLRFVLPLVPGAASRWAWVVILIGVIGTLYGALLALVQDSLPRLLAFACVSHMGSVMVGLFTLNADGLQGALSEMLNLGVAAAGLAFVAGFLRVRLRSSSLTRLGGLSDGLPLLTLMFAIVALAMIGMPLTIGFDAEHHVLQGALDAGGWPWAVSVAMASLLGAAYLFRYYQHAFLGPAQAKARPVEGVPDLSLREVIIAGSLSCMIVGFGIFSGPLFGAMAGSVKSLTERMVIR